METICDGVWQITGPSLRLPVGVRVPSRSTVVRVSSGDLLIYSPIAEMPGVDALGHVAHIVEPNRLHHLFVAGARARWPDAQHHARELQLVDPDIDSVHIAGVPKIDETVLFHRPSGTLIVADLFFNMVAENAMSRLAFAITGVGGNRVAQSREWPWACKDRPAARAAMARVLLWPIQRIAFCHGQPVVIDAAALAELSRI